MVTAQPSPYPLPKREGKEVLGGNLRHNVPQITSKPPSPRPAAPCTPSGWYRPPVGVWGGAGGGVSSYE